jgi:salicylate hydroxylase
MTRCPVPCEDTTHVADQFELSRKKEPIMLQSPPRVAIVGGGIGGLFAANALIAQGIPVSVYEQAPAIGEVGAGVYLTPNSVRHLQRIGLGPAVEKWGARVGRDSHYFRHDGTPIAPVQVTDSSGWNATFGMHRADLVDMLAGALPAGTVHAGHRCTGFDQDDDTARVSFANGATVEAEIVIGADGIHSELRPHVFASSQPVFSGSVAYRGLVAHERVPDWPTDRWQMWLGKGRHFLAFPVRAGKLINYVGFVPSDEEMKESWSAPGDPEILRQAFAGWDQRIHQLLGQVHLTFRWALYDREPLPVWTKQRLTLLGDAAHPMLPHLGQGANQSIEDGMALATILAQAGRRAAPSALLAYERLRRERVAQVQRGARENGLRYDSACSDLGVRDAEITAHAAFRKRLYDHDVLPDAQAAAAALV